MVVSDIFGSLGKEDDINPMVRDYGMIIVEGFNYPRLDTMLLAMPISFEGNVEQYAGRLNRDYDGKKDVIIFDYIDQHIPVLERMYHRRLRTYKKIGFEVCSEVMDKQDQKSIQKMAGSIIRIYWKGLYRLGYV